MRIFLLTSLIFLSAPAWAAPDQAAAARLLQAFRGPQHDAATAQALAEQVKQTGWTDTGLLRECLRDLLAAEQQGMPIDRDLLDLPPAADFEHPVTELSPENLIRRLALDDSIRHGLTFLADDAAEFLEKPSQPAQRIALLQALRANLAGPVAGRYFLPTAGEVGGKDGWRQWLSFQRGFYLASPTAKVIGLVKMMAEWDRDPAVRAEAQGLLAQAREEAARTVRLTDPQLAQIGQALWADLDHRSQVLRYAVGNRALREASPPGPLASCFDDLANVGGSLVGAPERTPAFVDARLIPGYPGRSMPEKL
jgi:hypothetical protein